jgi:hypothetical protein
MGITGITEFYDTVIPKKSKINFVCNEHEDTRKRPGDGRSNRERPYPGRFQQRVLVISKTTCIMKAGKWR